MCVLCRDGKLVVFSKDLSMCPMCMRLLFYGFDIGPDGSVEKLPEGGHDGVMSDMRN